MDYIRLRTETCLSVVSDETSWEMHPSKGRSIVSYKTTQTITREKAIEILIEDIYNLPNDTLGDLLDTLADSGQSHMVSQFDNFIVSDVRENK